MVVLFCLKENVSFLGAIQAGQIGGSTARIFFHEWIQWIVTTMYDEYVHPPETPHEISSTMAKFERLGLPGCITLFDGVHILWEMCPTALAPLHRGKDGKPSRTFNFASDCNRRIHHVHGSDVGARNDKTLARVDVFMQDIHLNRRYHDQSYTLFAASGEPRQYKGAWALTDGGYHRWLGAPRSR